VVIVVWALIDVAFVGYVILCYWYGSMWSVLLVIGSVLLTRLLTRGGWVP